MSTNTDISKKKILLIYTGYEQGSWGNIAYSCKTHYYIMPGILYCYQALKNDPHINETCEISYTFFNGTVESRETILASLTHRRYDLVGFSTYCWNREDHLYLAEKLKRYSPNTAVVFGGPEVYMENETESASFFKNNPFIDGLVFGDAANKLAPIVKALVYNDKHYVNDISGFSLIINGRTIQDFHHQPGIDINTVPSPYPFDISIPHSRESGLAMVYETGCGCPNRCIFCKFGRGKIGVHRLTLTRVEEELRWLMSQKIECIHFADATFDLQPDYAKCICRIIKKHNITSSIFFYCSFLKLDEELVSLFDKIECQIGVGIQSTNPNALQTMRRVPNETIFKNSRQLLLNHQLNFYTDIIFGLPNDDPRSFAETFNRVMTLHPAFIMSFPLSIIKGTDLAKNQDQYGMVRFGDELLSSLDLQCDIEYQNIALHKTFGTKDLEEFDDVALALFYFYNRFCYTLSFLLYKTGVEPFTLYQTIGKKTKDYLKKTGQRASNTNLIEGFQDEILKIFSGILEGKSLEADDHMAFQELWKIDLFRILILESPQRKTVFDAALPLRNSAVSDISNMKNKNVQIIKTAYGKVLSLPCRFTNLQGIHRLNEPIFKQQDRIYMYAPFNHWNVSIDHVSSLEDFLITLTSEKRSMRLSSVIKAAQRQFRSSESGEEYTEEAIIKTLTLLQEREIILIYDAK